MCNTAINGSLSQEQAAVIAEEINHIVGTGVSPWLRNDAIAWVAKRLRIESITVYA